MISRRRVGMIAGVYLMGSLVGYTAGGGWSDHSQPTPAVQTHEVKVPVPGPTVYRDKPLSVPCLNVLEDVKEIQPMLAHITKIDGKHLDTINLAILGVDLHSVRKLNRAAAAEQKLKSDSDSTITAEYDLYSTFHEDLTACEATE